MGEYMSISTTEQIKTQHKAMMAWVKEVNDRIERLCGIALVVKEQAEDEGLWFIAKTAPEAYLQKALRRLHEVIEHKSGGTRGSNQRIESDVTDITDTGRHG